MVAQIIIIKNTMFFFWKNILCFRFSLPHVLFEDEDGNGDDQCGPHFVMYSYIDDETWTTTVNLILFDYFTQQLPSGNLNEIC